MPAVLDFELRLSRQSEGIDPDVRMWIDLDGNQQMDNNEEIRPLRRDGQVWRGTRMLASEGVAGTGFLVRFQAARGTRWRLRVWADDGDSRHLAFEQDDVTQETSHRIIGWCHD